MDRSGLMLFARLLCPESSARGPQAATQWRAMREPILRALDQGLPLETVGSSSLLATIEDGLLPAPSLVLDLVDQAYLAFRERRESLADGRAGCPCVEAERVRVVFVVHYARWAAPGGTDGGSRRELARLRLLTKHRALRSEVRVTDPAMAKMGLDPQAAGLVAHGEGASGLVGTGWTAAELEALAGDRVAAGPLSRAETSHELEAVLPLPPLVAWDWLLSNDKRELWEEMDISSIQRADRRLGKGTRFRSRHGKRIDELYEVVDWKPFSEWTWDVRSRGHRVRTTIELRPHPGGTRVVQRFGVPTGTGMVRRWRAQREILERLLPHRSAAFSRLRRMIAGEQSLPRLRVSNDSSP